MIGIVIGETEIVIETETGIEIEIMEGTRRGRKKDSILNEKERKKKKGKRNESVKNVDCLLSNQIIWVCAPQLYGSDIYLRFVWTFFSFITAVNMQKAPIFCWMINLLNLFYFSVGTSGRTFGHFWGVRRHCFHWFDPPERLCFYMHEQKARCY